MKVRLLKKIVILPLAAVLTALAAFFCWGLVEAAGLTVTRVDFPHPDVPAAFDGFTIAFLSDFHFGPFFSARRTERAVATANALHPDLILLGGDYVDVPPEEAKAFFRILGGLKAPFGTYGVLGNGDYRGAEEEIAQRLSANGVTVIEDRGLWIERPGSRIRLGGVREMGTWRYDLAPALAGTKASDFVILLVHQPDFAEKEKDGRLDLELAGHTHGGQVNLFGWSPSVPSSYGARFRGGVVKVRETTLVISRGLGTTILPLRVGSPPEIVLVTLRGGKT
ncbi:MAG: metallophosphoesterase [Spirochaetales bacterium]|nr:metallophosphoesterase [Spirochaetales bacterium]